MEFVKFSRVLYAVNPPMTIQALTKLDRADQTLIANTVCLAATTAWLFSPTVALCCVVAHVALAKLNENNTQGAWYPLNDRVGPQLREYWNNSFYLFTARIAMGLIHRAARMADDMRQLAGIWFVEQLKSPATALWAIFDIAILTPFAEETLFRGFFQEKIRDVQMLLFGKEADEKFQKIGRVFLQALAFAWAHYHPSQGFLNVTLLALTGIFGYWAGMKKEETSNLWTSTAAHAHLNGSGAAYMTIVYT